MQERIILTISIITILNVWPALHCVAQPCINEIAIVDKDDTDIENYLDQVAMACLNDLSDSTLDELKVKVSEYKSVMQKYIDVSASQRSNDCKKKIQDIVANKIAGIQSSLKLTNSDIEAIESEYDAAAITLEEYELELSNLDINDLEYDGAYQNVQKAAAEKQKIESEKSVLNSTYQELSSDLDKYTDLYHSI